MPTDRRRTIGTVMIVAGVLGLVVSVVGTIVGWRLAGSLTTATDDSLVVTLETLDSVDDTIDLSEEVLRAIRDTVTATESSLTSIDDSLVAGSEVVAEVDDRGETVGPSLGEVARVLRQLVDVGATIDSLLGDLSRVPFGPDYDPEQELGDTIGELAVTVEQLPDRFETTSSDLDGFEGSLGSISDDLAELRVAVADVGRGLDDSERLLVDYRANVDQARTITESAQDDVGLDVGLFSLLLVVGGFGLALGQVVPLWLGNRLRRGDPSL